MVDLLEEVLGSVDEEQDNSLSDNNHNIQSSSESNDEIQALHQRDMADGTESA